MRKTFLFNLLVILIIIPLEVNAHTFTGMVGFFDGLYHPVIGLDHFLAMISVGIISAQIGGRFIWTVPSTFVIVMLFGGIIGIYIEMNQMAESVMLNDVKDVYFADIFFSIIEIGILISVIVLGLIISIEKKLPANLMMIAVGFFGFFHGSAHGLEMPQAVNPILFALGFATGTAILHLFGVIIGYFAIKTKISNILLKLTGVIFFIIGFYSLFIYL